MLPVCGRLSAAAAACCGEELPICFFVEGLVAGPEEALSVRRVRVLSGRSMKGLFVEGHVEGLSVRRRVEVLPAPIGEGRSVVFSLEEPSFNVRLAIKSLN